MEFADGILIGVISTLIGAAIIAGTKKIRHKRIRGKIEDLELEEDFLQRVSKGNINLLRSSFKLIFLVMGVSFFAIGLYFISHLPFLSKSASAILKTHGAALVIAMGVISILHSLRLDKLGNLRESIKKITDKKEKLERKLDKQ